MTRRYRWAASALVLCLASLGVRGAAADGLARGAPLQYGHPYSCGGERVVVGRCHHEADDADCQVIYPDRPERGGFTYETVEPRGDVLRRLQACAGPATAARPSAPAPKTAAPVHAPGLGASTWKVLFLNPVSAGYFTPGSFKRSGGKTQGWFTDIYAQPATLGPVKGVTFQQMLDEGDCAAGTLRQRSAALYAADGRLLGEFSQAGVDLRPQAGSVLSLQLDVLCGRRVQLYSDLELEMTVRELQENYATVLVFQRGRAKPR